MKSKLLKIVNIVGARPNLIKIAPLLIAQKKYPTLIKPYLIHTGQHYTYEMSGKIFIDLDLPRPDFHLNIGAGTPLWQIAQIMIAVEKILLKLKPDLLIVVGDVNSTLATSLVASKLHIKIAHVEAGLRSFNCLMPEELNRVLTDQLSDFLFTTDVYAGDNLLKEGIPKNKIFLVGNVMIDTLLRYKKAAQRQKTAVKLGLQDYLLLTLHRPENVDNICKMKNILNILGRLTPPIIWPIHPRTQKMLKNFKLTKTIQKLNNLRLLPPQGYLDFLNLEMNAKLVLTDSGGIQEETTILGVPCLTLRDETERPITVTAGTNHIVSLDKTKIHNLISKYYDSRKKVIAKRPPLWDDKTADRIIKIIIRQLNNA